MTSVASRRVQGFAFRAGSPSDTDLRAKAEASKQDPGRFNTREVGAVYVAREPSTAMDELRRNAGREGCSLIDRHPCSILVVRLSLVRLVDLTDEQERARWNVTMDDLMAEDMARCQAIGAEAAKAGAEAIRWPSATGKGQSLALFVDRLDRESVAVVEQVFDLPKEMLSSIDRGVPLERLLSDVCAFPPLDA